MLSLSGRVISPGYIPRSLWCSSLFRAPLIYSKAVLPTTCSTANPRLKALADHPPGTKGFNGASLFCRDRHRAFHASCIPSHHDRDTKVPPWPSWEGRQDARAIFLTITTKALSAAA